MARAAQQPHPRRVRLPLPAARRRARHVDLRRRRARRLPRVRVVPGVPAGAADAQPADDGGRRPDEHHLRVRRRRLRADDLPRRAGRRCGTGSRAGACSSARASPKSEADGDERTPPRRLSRRHDERRADRDRDVPRLAALHLVLRDDAAADGRPPDGRRRRQLPAARGAVLHPRRQPDELGRHHQPHLQLRAGAGRLAQGRARPRQRRRQRRSSPGMSGTAVADAGGLGTIEIKAMQDHGYPTEFARGHHRGVGDAGADHPAVAADGDLRRAGEHVDRQALRRAASCPAR